MEEIEKFEIKIKAFIVFILFSFIAIFSIFFFGLSKVEAQSIYFVRPTQIRLQTGSGIANGTILSCTDTRVCGTLNNTSTYGPYFSYTWRISNNSTDDTITELSKGEYYKISFTGTIQAIGSNVATAYNLYALVNNDYVNASCDVTPKFTTEKFTDTSNRYSFSYTCDKFYVDNTITWLALTIQGGNQKNYTYVNNLYLQDITEESAIIDNDNINTDKIIENNNQNTQDIIENNNTNADKIVDALEGEDLNESEKEPVNKDELNSYEDAENKLLNEDNLNYINDIDIALDSNSSEFIWDLITRILNTHALVFGAVITILSLGVIKLVLNR